MEHGLAKKDLTLITELKEGLIQKHGSIIEKVYCYGSKVYAQREEADFDILVVTGNKLSWQEERVLYRDIFLFGLKNDIQFDVRFFSSEEVNKTHRQMPFLKSVLSYSVAV